LLVAACEGDSGSYTCTDQLLACVLTCF
jgi:hypothetical protein